VERLRLATSAPHGMGVPIIVWPDVEIESMA
jgi:hypothetical protein